ncbi:MAG: NAD(P)-dependent oxidoreductase [Clostridia bacterium]|nr:NAD(P)-dependent oxidoreductase [Clostridia bacterium]
MENKTALITGANGFIGSHLSCKLVEQGFKVIGIYRKNSSQNPLFNRYVQEGKIIPQIGDFTTFDYSKIGYVDYIFNIAGKVSAWGSIDSFMKINYVGAKKLIDFAKQIKPKCFCQFSSVAVYGFDGYVNLKEEAEKKPFKNGYSISKLETENMVKDECEKSGIDYLIVRPGNVYGEYDYTSSHEIYTRIKKQKMLISAGGKYKSCFVYVGNLVDAVVHLALNKDCHNTDYNLTDGNNETLKEMFTCIAKEFKVKPKFTNVPGPIAKLFAILVESWYKLFRLKKSSTNHKILCLAKLRRL